ncbi:MAG: hypothetical protein M0R74_12740 [Dehalococcoidia bacterium]|nr:hypothetical protein [Dehalococcoidia bacterium]
MNAKSLFFTSLVGLTLLVAACGGDSKDDASSDTSQQSESSDTRPDDSSGDELVLPGQYLEFDGRKYELIEVIAADNVDEADFAESGEATAVAIDSSGTTVFERAGDATNVYTFEHIDGDGESVPDNWLKWKPVS